MLTDFVVWTYILTAVLTLLSLVLAALVTYRARRQVGDVGALNAVRHRQRIAARNFAAGAGFVATILMALLSGVQLWTTGRALSVFIDTPREVLIVSGSLVAILCSIVCTIYFRPARMTVIAGVALGFIAAVLFVEFIFFAQGYMDRRVGAEKKAFIETRAPSTT